MSVSSKFRGNFSWMGLGVALLTCFVLANPVGAQTRGFPDVLTESNLAVSTFLDQWQAIQNDLRSNVGHKRRPVFEFRVLPSSIPGGNTVEKPSANQLPKRIILVMGGLQTSLEAAERFAVALSDAAHDPAYVRMAVFGYPNDGSIGESAIVLRELLLDLHSQSPATRVSIVAHSMGGLVARHAIEPVAPKTGCQVPCVDQLVMICPPNHGSVLAQYADALEFSDALHKLHGGSLASTQVIESLVNDGLGEACEQLVPNSPFLCELNSRARADGVRYSIIAGTGGPVGPFFRFASSVALKETRERTGVKSLPNARDILQRADELLLSDEFAQGLGDGAVSLQSAKLPDVREFVTVPIKHGEWAQTDRPQVQQLVQATAAQLCPIKSPEKAHSAPPRAKF